MNLGTLLPLGLAILAVGAAQARPTWRVERAPEELSPGVSVSAWRCKQGGEDGAHPDLDVEVSLRQLPAVSEDGTLAVGVHELVEDDESDPPRPPTPHVAADIIWRSRNRVVVYFVDLKQNRAQEPIGLRSAPLYPPADESCRSLRRGYEKTALKVSERLAAHRWSRLRPLLTNLPEPHRRSADAPTTQRRTVGDAQIEFRYPRLSISWGDHHETMRLRMAGYPGRTRADEPYGYLELEPRGVNTWLTDLWLEPKNGILVMRLMTAQMSDAVLGNAFTFFYKLSPEQVAHLCPDCGRVLP